METENFTGEKEDDGFFEVEALIDVRVSAKDRRKLEFLVKWKGYPTEQASWVVEDDVGTGCAEYMAKVIAEKHRAEAIQKGCLPKDTATKAMQQKETSAKSERDGREVESILGAIKEGGNVMLLVKWQGTDTKELVPSQELRKKSPKKLIEFYQSKLKFI